MEGWTGRWLHLRAVVLRYEIGGRAETWGLWSRGGGHCEEREGFSFCFRSSGVQCALVPYTLRNEKRKVGAWTDP